MAGLYSDDFIEALRRGACTIAPAWGLSPRTEITLIAVSENATFRADDPDRDTPLVLRVHRPGYHTEAEIASELAWLQALRAERIAPIPAPVATRTGELIARFEAGGETRRVVAFDFMTGAEPTPEEDLTEGFRALGAISARLHRHAKSWSPPAAFARKVWDFDAAVGPDAHWGDWRRALGLTDDGAAVLARAAAAMQARLAAFGAGPDRFGLIHADLRLANLLIDPARPKAERIGVIDFDDCGFGWFAFDFAAAISFFETDPQIPALQAAWVEGYRGVADLPRRTEAELPTFVMLRRLQLTAWIATHHETPTAAELGAAYTDGTVALAQRYLKDFA